MKISGSTFAAFLAAATLFPGAARAQGNPGDSVFAGIAVHTVNFVFPQSWSGAPGDTVAWSAIHQQLISNKEAEIYIPARLEINCDATRANPGCLLMDSVGVRYKGNSTFSSGGAKRPFRVSFDAYGIDQRWNGVKGFTLNNGWSDPSLMREKIHMDFAVVRAGMAGPRMAYANVRVNGKAHAFYMLGELADGRLLQRYFGGKDGDLFKAIDGLSNNSDFTTASFTGRRYENKSDSVERGWARLGQAIAGVNGSNHAQDMPNRINLNSVYRGLGTDILFSSMDSYVRAAQNYQVYFPEAAGSKMEWILWDASLSFGAINVGSPTGTGTQCTNSATLSILCGVTGRPLLSKIVTTPALRDDYLRALWFLYNAHFAGGWLHARIDSVATVIRPHVQADTKKLSQGFESDITTVKNFVTNRQNSVSSQFATQGITAANAIRNGDVTLNEIAPSQGWVEVHNARNYAIDLSGHSLSDNPAQPNKWSFPLNTFVEPGGQRTVRLQGAAGSGPQTNFTLPATGGHLRLSRANGTVLDSVTFGAQSGVRTFSRLANGTGPFGEGVPTPGLANVSAGGLPASIPALSVVINEFMADNDTFAAPAGVKADWVELFNTTSSAVSLAGMHLSDNANNPSKWTFPSGTSIAAGGYLVVWAYDTTFAGSLHASWSLSKDGEHVRLSNADLSVVDSVTFGVQSKNRSMARIPNGSGAFAVNQIPTLGVNNGNVVSLAGTAAPVSGVLEIALAGGVGARAVARFTLASRAQVFLSVHDLRGREVAVLVDGRLDGGAHAVAFDAARLPPGPCFFRLRAGRAESVRAAVIVR